MDAPLPADVVEQLSRLQGVVSGLEAALQPFTLATARGLNSLEPLPQAEAHLALAQAAHALQKLFLRARGIDPRERVHKDATRLAQYKKKVAKAAAEKELRESRRSLVVDVTAMSRFIAAAVPDLSAQQRAALKAGGAAAPRAPPMHEDGDGKGGKRRQRSRAPKDEALAFLQETLAGAGAGGGGGDSGANQEGPSQGALGSS